MADLRWNGDKFIAQLSSWAERRSMESANMLAEELRNVVGHQGHKGYHSSPGEPPFRQSGELQRSITVRKQQMGGFRGFLRRMSLSEQVYEVAITAPHAVFLERGTSKMEPRPFIGVTIERMRARLEAMLKVGG